MCIESQLNRWQQKVRETGEPLTKEETEKVLEWAEILTRHIENGSLDETLLDTIEYDKEPDCLNGE